MGNYDFINKEVIYSDNVEEEETKGENLPTKTEEKKGRGRPKGAKNKNKPILYKDEVERVLRGMTSSSKMACTKEETNRMTKNTLLISRLPKIDKSNPREVAQRIEEYFEICYTNGYKPNIAGMSLALHMDRVTFMDICNGTVKMPVEVVDVMLQAKRTLNDLLETYQYESVIAPVSAIFLSKNNFGYKDQTEQILTARDKFGDVKDVEELRNKYLDDIVDDSIDV